MDASIAMDSSGSTPDEVLHVQEACDKEKQNSVTVNSSIEEVSFCPQPPSAQEKRVDAPEQASCRNRAAAPERIIVQVRTVEMADKALFTQRQYCCGNTAAVEPGTEKPPPHRRNRARNGKADRAFSYGQSGGSI